MKLVMWDIEVYPNLFIAVFYDPYIKEYKTFTLWEHDDTVKTNQIKELKAYLKEEQDTYFVGYNSLGYDMQILTEMLKMTGVSCFKLKEFNDRLINSEWPIYKEEQLCNKTLDLMLINNFGPRSAKSTSLKKLEFNLRKKKIQDLPYHFNDIIDTATKVEEIIKYCKYDVEVTLDVFRLSKELIKLRIEFGELNNINILNSPEPDITKKYFSKLLSEYLNISEKDLKTLKTYAAQNEYDEKGNLIKEGKIVVKDLILDYIDIKNIPEYVNVLNYYKSIELKATLKSAQRNDVKLVNLKKSIEYTFNYNNTEYVYAAGGIHASIAPGVYFSDDEWIIEDYDKVSYYPHFGMIHGINPKQFPKEIYSKVLTIPFLERKKYPKKTHLSLNEGFKLILNTQFGLTNSEYGLLFDTEATLATTVNGMLTLTMLLDMLYKEVPYIQLLQANTDGISIRYKRKDINIVHKIYDILTEIDKIPYEIVEYDKMIIKDVNNYYGLYKHGEVKSKGCLFNYEDLINSKAYHKDSSAMIIPKALKAYYIEGVPVEDTINKENSIYEFCYGNKGSNSYKWMLTKHNTTTGISKSELFDSRFVRYFAGGTDTLSQFWVKGARNGTIQAVQAQTPITMLMNVPKEDILDIDRHGNHKPRLNAAGEIIYRYPTLNREWYIAECYKIINQIN